MPATLLNGAMRFLRFAVLAALLGVAACGHKSSPATVGVNIGVALTAPSGTTVVEAGASLEIDAAVSNDPKGGGVVWTLYGDPRGAAYHATTTPTKYVYTAPASVTGALTLTLTATSIDDAAQIASVTITVNGSPVIPAPVLFPANVNVPYVAYINAAGGLAPYTWTTVSGTLPAGLTLSTSSTATAVVSGTPTATGTSTVVLKLTDANNATAQVTLKIVITPQSACVLAGRFTYLFTGFRDAAPVVRAGTLNIASDGSVEGEHDYKDAKNARVNEAITDGTCTTLSQNRGNVRLVTANIVEQFDFGVDSALAAGQMQENDSTPVVGSGQLFQQDATKFTAAAVAGDYAFGLVGDDGHGNRLTVVGRLSVDAAGAVSGGQADANSALVSAGAQLTGQFLAPDADGRGTATLAVGGLTLPVAYYVIDGQTMFVVSDDSSTSTPRLAGRMSRQTGAGTMGSTSLGVPSVLSLFGSSLVSGQPGATLAAGLLAGGSAGVVAVQVDSIAPGTVPAHGTTAAAPYTVAANGRGTLTLDNTTSAPRNFVLYLSAPGSGYLIEPATVTGNFGTLDAQTGAPFDSFPTTYFEGGTVFACSTSPITLAPQLLFAGGALSGNVTGTYALDPVTGRLIASVSRNVLGGTGLVGYLISAKRMVLIGDGVNSVNSSLSWLTAF